MNNEHIFDLTNIEDLPEEVKKEMRFLKPSGKAFSAEVLETFSLAGRPLSIDEVLAAHYRIFGKLKKRKDFTSCLSLLTTSAHPRLKRVGDSNRSGLYELIIVKKRGKS